MRKLSVYQKMHLPAGDAKAPGREIVTVDGLSVREFTSIRDLVVAVQEIGRSAVICAANFHYSPVNGIGAHEEDSMLLFHRVVLEVMVCTSSRPVMMACDRMGLFQGAEFEFGSRYYKWHRNYREALSLLKDAYSVSVAHVHSSTRGDRIMFEFAKRREETQRWE